MSRGRKLSFLRSLRTNPRDRFADSGGWGYAQFDYDAASDTFTPNTSIQRHDAKCGVACHTIVKAKDYVFTAYPTR